MSVTSEIDADFSMQDICRRHRSRRRVHRIRPRMYLAGFFPSGSNRLPLRTGFFRWFSVFYCSNYEL